MCSSSRRSSSAEILHDARAMADGWRSDRRMRRHWQRCCCLRKPRHGHVNSHTARLARLQRHGQCRAAQQHCCCCCRGGRTCCCCWYHNHAANWRWRSRCHWAQRRQWATRGCSCLARSSSACCHGRSSSRRRCCKSGGRATSTVAGAHGTGFDFRAEVVGVTLTQHISRARRACACS